MRPSDAFRLDASNSVVFVRVLATRYREQVLNPVAERR